MEFFTLDKEQAIWVRDAFIDKKIKPVVKEEKKKVKGKKKVETKKKEKKKTSSNVKKKNINFEQIEFSF